MQRISKSVFSFFFFLFSVFAFGQETASGFQWKASSKKMVDGKYELSFTTDGVKNWQLYAAGQSLDGFKPTEIVFNDSLIKNDGTFIQAGNSKTIPSTLFAGFNVIVYEGKIVWKTVIEIIGEVPAKLLGTLSYTYGNNLEFYPSTAYSFSVDLEGGVVSTTKIKIDAIDLNNPVNNCGDDNGSSKSLIGIFLLGLLGGFIGLLTPCVFPLIPLTVSFFTKRSQTKKSGIGNAVLYGVFIFVIYVLLSLPFHILDQTNPEILNNISTNFWLNIVFFVIFVVFAISFFGYFEISLPSGIAGKADSKSGIGNTAGIFFMALTLAIVSFSCTGPILGSLLAGALSNDGGAMQLTFGMGGFGLGLALPFALFAMFPGWLQSMPKSGGWLTNVKVVLGFLELALAVKFLSNADLVKQWGFLRRETFIAIWIIIGIAIVMYLIGKIRFPHDSPIKKYSKVRIGFIVVFSLFTLYLMPGVTNSKYANLTLISGFPPPLCYSVFEHPVNCEKDMEPLRDYDEALALARKENKPLLIDFTGWACVNCRRMEEKIWIDPNVARMMKKDFVLVSLYVDERIVLPASKQLEYTTKTGAIKQIITVGDKWATFQSENFNAVSQPQYAIIGTNEKAMTKTKGYTSNAKEFAAWLKCGLNAFEKSGK